MSISAKQLAEMLGLSPAAVSLALNDKPGVSTATKRKVYEAAKQYGYDFTIHDKNVHLTETICLVIYKKSGAVVADTPFFEELINGVCQECKRQHYILDIRYIFEDDNLETQLRNLRSLTVSGIILLATEMDMESIASFSMINVPIVVLDSYFELLDYTCVLINNVQGAYTATNYLIMKRKSQPGYLQSSYPISNFEERADGFFKAIRANGMSPSKTIVHKLTPSQDGAYEDMKQLLDSGEEIASCYFADNDHIAIGAIQAFKEFGYSVPEDIAVVGFDDLPVCEYFSPPLTTISVPKHLMGAIAVQHLLQSIEHPEYTPVKTELRTSLKKRKSV